jgi:hypothetical protein
MHLLKILAVVVTLLQALQATVASTSLPLEIPGVSTADMLVSRALLVGLVLHLATIIVCALFMRGWRDAGAVALGMSVTLVLSIFAALAGMVAHDVFALPMATLSTPVFAAVAVALCIGAYSSLTLLLQSKLTEKIGASSADFEIDEVKPFVFWFFALTFAANVTADVLFVHNMIPITIAIQLAVVLIVWVTAYHADRRFEKLMA